MPGRSGFISNNGYPSLYEPNSDCTYSLDSSPTDYVKFVFVEEFGTEDHETCQYDYVEVIIGDQSSRFCGPNLPSDPVEGIGIARIVFASDSSVQDGPGFKVEFEVTVREQNVKTFELFL